MVSISVVIPVYHAEQTLEELAATLATELPEITDSYEVIMVDDGSRDSSWKIIQEMSLKYSWLHGTRLLRNYGQHAALLCGIRAARFDVIVTMDDDLQHPPSEIRKLLDKLDEGYDVVYGAAVEKQHTMGRNLGSLLLRTILSTSLGVDAAKYASAFRAFRANLRDAFATSNSPDVAIDVLLTWGTAQFSHVFVEHRQAAMDSRYTLRKLIRHAVVMLVGYSTIPLHFASYIGFGLTLLGIILVIYLIPVRYLVLGYRGEIPGFTFLACIIVIFSGVQLFSVGVIGGYLARMHLRLMDRPPYVVGGTTKLNSEDA